MLGYHAPPAGGQGQTTAAQYPYYRFLVEVVFQNRT